MKTHVIIFSALVCASSLSAMDKSFQSQCSREIYQIIAARAKTSIAENQRESVHPAQQSPSQLSKELYGTIAANAAARTTQNHKPEVASASPIASPVAPMRMIQVIDNAARLPKWVIKCISPKSGKPYYLNGDSLQAFELLPESADLALPALLKN